ncbi:MAG TPA: hypothetical protein VJS65_05440 [Verrucomicrobiae bacterium]|nr:hypothetical protein [Verrucomicrobiae bacterium]
MKLPRTSSLIRGRRAAGSSWSKAAFWVVAIFLTPAWVIPGANAQQPAPLTPAAGAEAGRFMVVDVMVETGNQPLAAYQIEVAGTNSNGTVKVVGIEGGEPAAFRSAPYYDPAAMQGERVILGAFSTAPAAQLPRGEMRIATVHCLVSGDSRPVFRATVSAAATPDGQPVSIQVNVKERNEK